MFVSIAYIEYKDIELNGFYYALVDSEFGSIEAYGNLGIWIDTAMIVVREYGKRNLPVGRNLALATLYMANNSDYSVSHFIAWQESYCNEHVHNWASYSKERDHYLEKLLPLK